MRLVTIIIYKFFDIIENIVDVCNFNTFTTICEKVAKSVTSDIDTVDFEIDYNIIVNIKTSN